MTGSHSRAQFRNSALLSGLISPEQLDAAFERARLAHRLAVAPGDLDGAALAIQLVDMGVLTRYQADQILEGRTKFKLGPYIVTDWIGQGGMGQVYKAVHEVMGRESAVKVLPMSRATPEAIANFTREIRMQAALDHPHLVRAYDAGHDGSVHYLVTEFVPGTDLRRLVRTQGPLSVQQAAAIVKQAADAISYAHGRGLIHRDVKPGNILVTPEGVAKVSDLGLAGFVSEAEPGKHPGKVAGTADYIAPELIRAPQEPMPVSDIYALGCTLYYAVCGKVPFPGGSTREKAKRHLEETPWHPRRFNPEIPEEFVEVIADMMEKNHRDRIATAAEVSLRLEPWAADASPVTTRKLTKSPWSAPPPPTGREEEDFDRQDSGAEVSQGGGTSTSQSQLSQGTGMSGDPPATADSVVSRLRFSGESLFGYFNRLSKETVSYIMLTLAIAVPVSMLFGAILASLMFWLLGKR